MIDKSPRFRHVVVSGSLALTFALIFAGGACGGGSGGSGTAGHAGTAGATSTAGVSGTAGATATAGVSGTAGATGTAGAAAANTPVGQCEQFVSTFCRRFIQCTPADAGATLDMPTCNTLFLTAFNCQAATATNTSDIPTCISDVGGESCASLFGSAGFNEPMSCTNAFINIPLTDAQSKCVTLVEEVCDPSDVCLGQDPANTTDITDCVEEGISVDQGLACEFVTGESSTFDQCISDLCVPPDGGTADGGASLPASCNNPVSYPPGTTM